MAPTGNDYREWWARPSWLLQLVPALAVLSLAGCATDPAATKQPATVRLSLSADVHALQATAVNVRIYYQRPASQVDLAQAAVSLPATSAELTVILEECLTDPQRTPLVNDACSVSAELVLLRDGTELDRTSVGPVSVRAGETASLPGATLHEIATIDIAPLGGGPLTFEPDSTVTLVATSKDESGASVSGRTVTWSTNSATVATINPVTGALTTVAPGAAQITATAGGRTGQVTVQVTQFAVRRVAITTFKDSLAVGQSFAFQATTFDRKNRVLTGRVVVWTSDKVSVATVNASGLVTGVSAGSTVIHATSDSAADTKTVRVTGQVGQLSGRVVDGLSSIGIAGALLTFFQNSVATAQTTTASDGSFLSPVLQTGAYDITASAPAFVGTTFHTAQVVLNQTTTLPQIPLAPSGGGLGTVAGRVTDAQTGGGIPGATVQIWIDMNNTAVSSIAGVTSDTTGAFAFTNLNAGTYTVGSAPTGYTPGQRTTIAVGNSVVPGQDLVLSATGSAARIVLTWGATPPDLDSHLTGPDGAGGRFHVYFGNKFALPYAQLDHDEVGGFGPETVTILQQLPGVYRYSVHDFSNGPSSTSTELSASGARVQLYLGGALAQEFFVPNAPGTLWTVFELDGTTITPVNSMSFVSAGGPFPTPSTTTANILSSHDSEKTDSSIIARSAKAKKARRK